MKSIVLFAAVLAAAPLVAQQKIPEIRFESVPDYFQYPAEMNLGELSGVAVNSKGHVFMISRSNTSGPIFNAIATQLLEFDEKGKFVREIGKGVYGFGYAHGVRIDRDDNIWVVDKGTDVIMRFNPLGHVTMVLGRKEEPTDDHKFPDRSWAPTHRDGYFNQPTDIAWDAQGNMYISDGYVNSRVAKIDARGNWIKSWGVRGSAPGQFNTPHNIGLDRQGNVYVADRGNARIQVFTTDGEFIRQIKFTPPVPPGTKMTLGDTPAVAPAGGTMAPGAPWTICITQGPTQYLYTSDAYPGRVYKLTLDGKVVGMLGIGGRELGQFNWLHAMACPSENELYVADLNNWRVQKLVLHPAP
ncbi:MAG TPA: peptidyl-alpha-hydroxyglycine alpha-amidating lyase family protein [Bryobacteraceae bacterium]|jgi:DNA-binding beta-propeller fold protein YncE|nr:peptidyl-alpha-hydroxyglycine alpha-amidating lyase family protein [Bryobacteraceae bacterium]